MIPYLCDSILMPLKLISILSVSGSSSMQRESLPSSPMEEATAFESDSSSGSSPYEDLLELSELNELPHES